MQPIHSSYDVFAAAQLHLSVLDEFIAVVEAKLESAVHPFTRDSLKDLLANLGEQREGYVAVVAPPVAAAA